MYIVIIYCPVCDVINFGINFRFFYETVFEYLSRFLTNVFIMIITCFLKTAHINNVKKLYYERIDISKGINVNKPSVSHKCIICHCWSFLGKAGFPQVLESPGIYKMS